MTTPQASFPVPPPSAAVAPYTPWITRVLAWVIDVVPVLVLQGIGLGVLLGTRETVCLTDSSEYNLGEFCATGASTTGQLSAAVAGLLTVVYVIWNLGYKQGTTGSSIGKGVMKFKVVSEKNYGPIGFVMSLVRQVAHFVDAMICYVGYLFPLWDAKRQTLADKMVSTICLPV